MTVFVSPNEGPAKVSLAGRAHTVPTYIPGSVTCDAS